MSEATPALLRVLVVDDSRDAADCLTMLLEMAGHQVETAYDGQAAVERAGSFSPDAVILDLKLPKLSGDEAAHRIRERLGAAVTLIALTGMDPNAGHDPSSDTPFDHYLTKPVEFDVLAKLLGDPPTP